MIQISLRVWWKFAVYEGLGCTAARISAEPQLVCFGDGQADI